MNQLAERYLERRQRELGRRIPHRDYADELQKVRHFIADRNVYWRGPEPGGGGAGRDLAVAELHPPGRPRPVVRVPARGRELADRGAPAGVPGGPAPPRAEGRSVVQRGPGAGAAGAGRGDGTSRGDGLSLPAAGPGGWPDTETGTQRRWNRSTSRGIAAWRKEFLRGFDEGEIEELEALSDQVDKLWALHAEQLGADHRETEDPLPVWGGEGAPAGKTTPNAWKDRIRAQGVLSEGTRTTSPYRRLKLVMDYWCALWFWPIRESELLPTRQDFLNEVSLVLTGSVYQPGVGTQVRSLFGDDYADADHARDIAQRITAQFGMLDLETLFEKFPRLRFVDELASCRRFHHWELAFADQFYGTGPDGKARGGFDPGAGEPAVDQGGVGGARRAGGAEPGVRAAEAPGGGVVEAAGGGVRAA